MNRSDILAKVSDYVARAISRLDRVRYHSETGYVDAFLGRLDGTIYLGEEKGLIDLKATIATDRGPNSAEKRYGADFALVFNSSNNTLPLKKAILGQAKNGTVERLNSQELSRLVKQCSDMAKVTHHYVVLEAPLRNGKIPTIRLGTYQNNRWSEQEIQFDVYLVDKIISCEHGDRRASFIEQVGDSKLTTLKVLTYGLDYEPDPSSSLDNDDISPSP